MLFYLLGAGVAGWLAGESFRRSRRLGDQSLRQDIARQRRLLPVGRAPIVAPNLSGFGLGIIVPIGITPPSPFYDIQYPTDPSLFAVYLLGLERKLLAYERDLAAAQKRLDELEASGASDEAIREAGANVQDLRRLVDDYRNAMKLHVEEEELKDEELRRQHQRLPLEEPAFPPIAMMPGVMVATEGARAPAARPAQAMLEPSRPSITSQMVAVPSVFPISERLVAPAAPSRPQSFAPAMSPATITKGAAPVPSTASVSMVQEATAVPMPQPTAATRPRISVPLPAGGGMAIPFSGT